MERRFILLFAFLLSVSLPGNAGAQNKVALEGKWRAVEATSNGEPPPAGLLEKLTVVFVGETVSVMGPSPTRFTIDTSFRPAHIDILNSRRQVGIYELKGDALKLCVGTDGDRPNAFRTEKYTDHTYMLLKRVKE
jgi:uncharacterized protein (TIGR03067 family)